LVSVSRRRCPALRLLDRRILRLVALGCNRREIAALLERPVETVAKRQAFMKRKAKVATLRELVCWARRNGLFSPSDRLGNHEQARLADARAIPSG